MQDDRYAVVDGQVVRRVMGGQQVAPEPTVADLQRQLSIERVLRAFPQADEETLQLMSGADETQLRSAAQRSHDLAIKAATPPAPPAPPADPVTPPAPPAPAAPPAAIAPVPPAGGGPVPIPGQGVAQAPEHVVDAHYQDLQRKVELKVATELERDEFFNLSFRGGWNEHMGKRTALPGRTT